ncbi:MAG: hypothetical protein K8T26_08935 [Lentisphaerae bacterium]|nr:hypothetical protein [Lentisphaerota bacterium]
MNERGAESRVENPEVLPPEGTPAGARPSRTARRFVEAFGPIGAGVLIDLADFVTYGPIGLMFGMLVGGTLAYVLSGFFGQPVWKRFLWALAAGLYCTIPGTEMIPLATILASAMTFWKGDSKE